LGGKKNVISMATFGRVDTFIKGMVEQKQGRLTGQLSNNGRTYISWGQI